jgi:hypothetical protein
MAKSKDFWLTKKIRCGIAHSVGDPKEWYSINQKSGFMEKRYFSIEKHTKSDMISYIFIVGPLCFNIGWFNK